MGVKVELTRDEIFRAIFQYVSREYPNMVGNTASINMDWHNKRINGAEVDCSFRKSIEENVFFKPRTMS